MSLTPKEQKDIKDSFLQTIYEFRQILKTNYILDLITLEFDGDEIILKIKVEDKLIEHAKEVIPLKGIYPILVGKFNFRDLSSYIVWLKVGYFDNEMPTSDSKTSLTKENAMIKEINKKLRNNYLGAFLVIVFINMSKKLGIEDVNLQDGTKKMITTEGKTINYYEKQFGFIQDDDNEMTLKFDDIENIDEYLKKLKENIKSHKNLIQYFQELTTDLRKQTLRPRPNGGKKTKKYKNKRVKTNKRKQRKSRRSKK